MQHKTKYENLKGESKTNRRIKVKNNRKVKVMRNITPAMDHYPRNGQMRDTNP